MKTAFEKLMSGLDEVEAFLAGEREGFRVQVPVEGKLAEGWASAQRGDSLSPEEGLARLAELKRTRSFISK